MCKRESRMTAENEAARQLTRAQLEALCYNAGVAWRAGEHEGKNGLYLRCECDKCWPTGEGTFVAFDALSGLSWGQIYAHVVGGRHVSHITRVVGYYSKIENWNPSRRGELKDRQRGRYSLVGNKPDLDANNQLC